LLVTRIAAMITARSSFIPVRLPYHRNPSKEGQVADRLAR
jgi:hypothetical protein